MRQPTTKFKPTPTQATAPVATRPRFPAWPLAILLALMTLVLYWPATRHDFVNYDDHEYVIDNFHVTSGLTLTNVRWAFQSGYAANWHPVTWLSHMADCQLYGLNPQGHHLTSVLLHALNTALAFALLLQLTGASWRSFLVAALFAVHPLHVESVAWVSERKDVLSGCFGLLSLICYVRFVTQFKIQNSKFKIYYGLALLCFALGLMSKPMLVTWPFVMLLLDYWPLERFQPERAWRLVSEKIPFFALAAAASVVTFVVQKHEGSMIAIKNLPLGLRGGNALISYCRYLGKLFCPTKLAIFYTLPRHLQPAEVLAAGGLLLGISALVIVPRRRYPWLLMGWLWFIGTLAPVIGLVQVGVQAMADRYTYIPSLGVLIMAVWGAYELTRRWRYQVMALSVAGSAAVVLCFGLTRQQLGYWRNSETLWRHTLAVTEKNYIAHYNFGAALYDKGQINEAIRQYQTAIGFEPDFPEARNDLGKALANKGQTDEAIRQYNEAIRLKPDYAKAHNNLAIALANQGHTDEAIRQWQEALRSKPEDAEVHNNLAIALGTKGQTDEAIRQFQEAVRLKPDYADAHYNLGLALGTKGQTDEEIRQLQKAIRLKPDYAQAHYNLGLALGAKGQTEEEIREWQEAIRLNPNDADAHNHLGKALAEKGQTDEAIREFQEAIRLKPDYAEAHYNLGNALARKGQMDEAISQFQEAIHLKPDYAEAHNNLGNALTEKGQIDEAIYQFQEAIRLKPDYAQACYNLGNALLNQGQTAEAIRQLQEAIRLKPDYAEAHNNLGVALLSLGRDDEAISQFQEAIRLKPDFTIASNNLARAVGIKNAGGKF